jgi:hypothetical protein
MRSELKRFVCVAGCLVGGFAGVAMAQTPAVDVPARAVVPLPSQVEKRMTGTVVRQEIGDVACYLTVRDEADKEVTRMADFDLCARHPDLTGRRVELAFTTIRLIDPSCGGDPGCKKTRLASVANAVKLLDDRADKTVPRTSLSSANFCTKAETTVFSCRMGAKLVSICADPASGVKSGYLQYRFGKLNGGDSLELAWPQGVMPPSNAATGGTDMFSGGGAAWLRIRKGDYAYVAYTGIGRWGAGGQTQVREGVVVEKLGKSIASLKCSEPSNSLLGQEWFAKVGIGSHDETFDLPD